VSVAAVPEPDGALQPALTALADAVHALCGPQSRLIEGILVHIPSRYLQLRDATVGEQSNTGGGGGSKSRPPFWTDAFDLIREIDDALEVWQPAFTGVPPTVGRLRCLQARSWRPQDTRQLEQITRAVAEWAHSIDTLLDPPRRWTLPSPCPNCNTATVYKRDPGGEMIRQPALQIGPNGCTCSKCRAFWPPERFVFLARVLGSLPENVLD
jgi:hypothetical protein